MNFLSFDWHVVPADAATVFDKDPARVWPELIERATTKRTRYLFNDVTPDR